MKNKQTKIIFYTLMTVFLFVSISYNWVVIKNSFGTAYAEFTDLVSSPPTPIQLVEKSVFRESEQSTIAVHPRFNDNTTNIAFYALCSTPQCLDIASTTGNPEMIFTEENLGHGYLPFSEYWSPYYAINKYVVVEYYNDEQQFSCSDLSLSACISDPHFISQFAFEIIGDGEVLGVATSTDGLVTISTIDGITASSISDSLLSTTTASSTDNIITLELVDGITPASVSDGATTTTVSDSVTLVFPDSIGDVMVTPVVVPEIPDINADSPVDIAPEEPVVVDAPAPEVLVYPDTPPTVVQDVDLNTTVTY